MIKLYNLQIVLDHGLIIIFVATLLLMLYNVRYIFVNLNKKGIYDLIPLYTELQWLKKKERTK
jgi:hypothetical protein